MWETSTAGAIASVAGGFWLASILNYFQVSWEVLIILSVMLALDYIFWIADAYLEDKQQVTSTKMRKWLLKKMTRWMLPLIVVAILRGVGAGDLDTVSTVIFSILIITEWYSIIWHIYSINSDWKKIPEIDAMEMLLQFIINAIMGKLPQKDNSLETIKEDEQTTQDSH